MSGVCPVAHKGMNLMGTCPVSHMSTEGDEMGAFGGSCPVSTKGGLDMKISIDGAKIVPVSNIPKNLSFSELKELLNISRIQLSKGKTWEEVEFFLDEHYWFPVPQQISLENAGVKNGHTIYISYKQSGKFL